MQKLKVDTESAMLEIDQILKANELSIALVAAIPSFLIAGISVVGIWRWLSPKPVDPKWEALPCRYILFASKHLKLMIHSMLISSDNDFSWRYFGWSLK